MNPVLLLSLIFLAIYVAAVLNPGLLPGSFARLAGRYYFAFSILFITFIYEHSSSMWLTICMGFLLIIFMYIIQYMTGSLKQRIQS